MTAVGPEGAGPISPSRKWKVDTYCRVKPKLSSTASAAHVQYDFRGPSAETPSVLRIALPPGSAPYIWNNRRHDMDFQFTEAFRPDVMQEYVYERVARDVVYSSLSGYNGTIFAYGQTGSGKTYTMTGGDSFTERGLIPRAIHDVYKEIKRRPGKRYRVLISYMEIYKESVYDLLDVTSRNKALDEWTKIQMLDDEDGEMHLRNLKLYEAATEEEALNLLFLGNWNRITSATPMNEASSRSHCIFTLRIQGESTSSGGRTTLSTTGKLNLVDLAGSERMYKTDAETMLKTRIEGRYINLSLHYLEQVIVTLQDKAGRSRGGGSFHIPYRNSVMTSILRDSLGGNCRTVFIVTLNTEVDHLEELISTCRFALRCAQLSTDVLANEEVNAEELAASLKLEVGALRSRLQVQEKQLQEVMQQLQALHTKHRPRPITQEERALCQSLTRDFVKSPGEDSSWVYDTDRSLLAECIRLLRRQVLDYQGLQHLPVPSNHASIPPHHYLHHPLSPPPPPPQPRNVYRMPTTSTAAAAVPSSSLRSIGSVESLTTMSSLADDLSPVSLRRRGGTGRREVEQDVEEKEAGKRRTTRGGGGGGEDAFMYLRHHAVAAMQQQQEEKQVEGEEEQEGVLEETLLLSQGVGASDKGSHHAALVGHNVIVLEEEGREQGEEEEDGEGGRKGAYFQRLLTRGGHFLKEGRQGRWHARFVLASSDLERLMWRKAGEVEVRGWVPMAAFEAVREGPGERALTLCGQERHVTLELVKEEGDMHGSRAEWAHAFRYAINRTRRKNVVMTRDDKVRRHAMTERVL